MDSGRIVHWIVTMNVIHIPSISLMITSVSDYKRRFKYCSNQMIYSFIDGDGGEEKGKF